MRVALIIIGLVLVAIGGVAEFTNFSIWAGNAEFDAAAAENAESLADVTWLLDILCTRVGIILIGVGALLPSSNREPGYSPHVGGGF